VPVQLTETVLRDAQQSLFAGRMRTADMLPAVERLDRVGYGALDAWGGATFESCVRYLGEDPWARLRGLKERARKTPLQMLLRGQALVGRQHFADDVVQLFIERAAAGGVDIFRIYDPLNDLRNVQAGIRVARARKGRVQGALIYTESPVHSPAYFAALAGELAAMGCDSIAMVDPSGLLRPGTVRELIRLVRNATPLPLHFNANCTSGLAPIAYLAAVEAGAAGLDTALSSMAWGASQPATETIAKMLAGSSQDPRLDLDLVGEINQYFDALHERYHEVLDPVVYRNDINILRYHLPVTQLAVVLGELRARNAVDRAPDVLKELPRLRADMGYPPLASPVSDIIGEQAVLNVLASPRYSTIVPALRDYCRGLLGRPPGAIEPALMRAAIGNEEPITIRPADLISPQLDAARATLRRRGVKPEGPDGVLRFLMIPDEEPKEAPVAKAAPRARAPASRAQPPRPAPAPPPPAAASPSPPAPAAGREYTVEVDGEVFKVRIHGQAAAPASSPPAATGPAGPADAASAGDGTITAPMQGLVSRVKVKPGDRVKLGDVVLILEAMKMQNDIIATTSGMVRAVHVQEGAVVAQDEPLITIG